MAKSVTYTRCAGAIRKGRRVRFCQHHEQAYREIILGIIAESTNLNQQLKEKS